MKLTFLGATREVGRSAILAETMGKRLLFDYGVMLGAEPSFPAYVPAKAVDLALLSHAHLDHSGAIPLFFLYEKARVMSTSLSFSTSEILLRDFIKLSGYMLPFEILEVHNMFREREEVMYREALEEDHVGIEFLDAGHIPGSAMILVNGDKRVLYTGDFSTVESRLLNPADEPPIDVDAVVIEATYGREDNPKRKALEEEFIRELEEVVMNGGIALVPAFSVGRSQEILCILAAHNFKHPVALDGMAVKILRMYLDNTDFVKDPSLLSRAANRIEPVVGRKKRMGVLENPGVIVSPAGMLSGGPAAYYMERLAGNSGDAVFLVSFQIPGTPGDVLLSENRYVLGGRDRRVDALVKQFKFSSHCGRLELHKFLERFDSGTKVFVVHGEEESCLELVRWAREELSLDAVAPQAGQSFEF
ncbi:MAG: MBL fold metallo-hydrolase [Aigarchaeota archaeon]|nr:MBL fold metallo-hydrolase [Aigarchaeota archaeon]